MAALKKTKKNSNTKLASKRLDASGSSLKIQKITKKKVHRVGAEIRPRSGKIVRKKVRKVSVLDLQRSEKNPIIEPNENLYWESKATFNPTAIEHDGKVHVIYRAIGDSDNSVLGYAKSHDGHSFDQDSKALAYYHKNVRPVSKEMPPIDYCSGGG